MEKSIISSIIRKFFCLTQFLKISLIDEILILILDINLCQDEIKIIYPKFQQSK